MEPESREATMRGHHVLDGAPAPLVELALDEALARSVLEQVPDGLLISDADGRVRLVNTGLEEMFGYDRAEMLGKHIELLVPENLRSRHHAHRERYGAAPHRRPMGLGMELEGRRRDGSTFPVEISLSPLVTGSETLTISTVRDISERVTTQQILAETRQRLAVSEERERIARDLHDKVIQRLFATGLSLQVAAGQAGSDALEARLQRAVDDLDEAIREIRTAIFALHEPPARGGRGLRHGVLDKVAEAGRLLGFAPAVRFVGPVETVTTPEITEAALATLQEALSNVARHAGAASVDIELLADERLVLTVRDDGRGIDLDRPGGGGRGLLNMRDRAVQLGGDFAIGAARPSGTELRWSVPLP